MMYATFLHAKSCIVYVGLDFSQIKKDDTYMYLWHMYIIIMIVNKNEVF